MNTKKIIFLSLGLALVCVVAAGLIWGKIYGPRCEDGSRPDANGCCAGEEYTNIDPINDVFACCPNGSDECFPPIK